MAFPLLALIPSLLGAMGSAAGAGTTAAGASGASGIIPSLLGATSASGATPALSGAGASEAAANPMMEMMKRGAFAAGQGQGGGGAAPSMDHMGHGMSESQPADISHIGNAGYAQGLLLPQQQNQYQQLPQSEYSNQYLRSLLGVDQLLLP